jgi:hypothetical protein
MVGVRMPDAITSLVDEWRAIQRPIPSRPEAIRRLVEIALASSGIIADKPPLQTLTNPFQSPLARPYFPGTFLLFARPKRPEG